MIGHMLACPVATICNAATAPGVISGLLAAMASSQAWSITPPFIAAAKAWLSPLIPPGLLSEVLARQRGATRSFHVFGMSASLTAWVLTITPSGIVA